MRYATTNSGISAESAAWKPLGWEPVWYSEIEAFPSAVLAHHYPEAPNLGDMTKIFDHEQFKNSISTIDLLSGGTPCQAFSQAGKGEGLDDPRGLLTLQYAEIAHQLRSRWVVWENVPKVLSIDEGRVFGLFLSALAGVWLQVPENGWSKSGVVEAPAVGYGLAWATLDAQYFGLAQRRKRVFVVGYLGDWRRAAAVLFDSESLSGNPAPSREKGQRIAETLTRGANQYSGFCGEPVAPTLQAGGKAAGSVTQQNAENGALVVSAFGGNNSKQINTATTLNAHRSRLDFESETFITQHVGGEIRKGEVANPIRTNAGRTDERNCPAIVVKGAAIGRKPEAGPQYGEILEDGSCYTLNTVDQHAVCFESRFVRNGRGAPSQITPPLKAENGKTGKGDGASLVFQSKASASNSMNPSEVAPSIDVGKADGLAVLQRTVRRLTPIECERLQGFPSVKKKICIQVWSETFVGYQKNFVNAEIKNRKLQKHVLIAEGKELNQNVNFAEKTLNTSHPGQEKHVVINVHIDLERKNLQLSSQKKSNWCVNFAAHQSMCPQHIKTEDFVRLLAHIFIIQEQITTAGKEGLQPNTNHSSIPLNGNKFAALYGQERNASVNDVGKFIMEVDAFMKFITSQVGQNSQHLEQVFQTLLSFVTTVISSCIPEEIKTESSFDLNINATYGYTDIPGWKSNKPEKYGGHGTPDGPRYRSIGNSMPVKVMRWLGERIQMVDKIENDG